MQKENYEQIGAYRCTVCQAIFYDEDEAKKHSQVPIDEPLPRGFVFCEEAGRFYKWAFIVIDKGKISKSKEDRLVHGYEQRFLKYSFLEDYCVCSASQLNSKDIRNRLKNQKAWPITDEELKTMQSSGIALSWIKEYSNQSKGLEKLVANQTRV